MDNWKCDRCATVHDFEEDEEPLGWFKCTMPVSPNDMSTQICGGTVKPDCPKAQEGTWTLTAPDGRQWTAESPLKLAGLENAERIPATERLRRIMAAVDGGTEHG